MTLCFCCHIVNRITKLHSELTLLRARLRKPGKLEALAISNSFESAIDSVARIEPEAFGLIGAVASGRRTTETVIVGC